MKIIHISDPHICARDPQNAPTLRMLLTHARTHHPDAEIVITGDLADTPTVRELEDVADIIGEGEHIVPGNHDMYRWGFLRWPGLRKQWHRIMGVEDQWPKIIDVDGGRLILIDSMMDVDLRRGSLARGRVGREQINAVRMALDTDRTCAVFLHHHLADQRTTLELIDADLLLDTLAGGGCVLACFGHLHEAREMEYRGVKLFASDKSTSSGRYRVIEVRQGAVRWWWESVRPS